MTHAKVEASAYSAQRLLIEDELDILGFFFNCLEDLVFRELLAQPRVLSWTVLP